MWYTLQLGMDLNANHSGAVGMGSTSSLAEKKLNTATVMPAWRKYELNTFLQNYFHVYLYMKPLLYQDLNAG